jgi:uncharacterized protein (DUF58 family)
VGAQLTLVPQPRLLAALLLGAAMIALTVLSPLLWALAAVYHAGLAWTILRDARSLPGGSEFTASRQLPDPLALGAEQTVLIGISCPRAAGLQAAVADHAPLPLRLSERPVEGVFDADGFLIVEYPVRSPRRGLYTFAGADLRIWRSGGWWLRQLRLPLEARVAVYPDVLAIKRWQLTLRRGVRVLPGQRRARPPGAATTPAELRDYLPGDDLRRVNWKASARRDSPVTTQLEAERGQQVVIALDCGRLMTAPAGHLTKLDQAVNAALLLGWVAQSHGDRVGLLTFADQVQTFLAPRRGVRQIHRLNEVLYRVQATYAEPEFGEAFAYLAREVQGRSLVVVLTDVLDSEASGELVAHSLRLGRRHRVLVVAMSDPEVLAALRGPLDRSTAVYEWAAAEELLSARRRAFETLQRGGVQCLDVEAGLLSPSVVERYLELKERGLI